MCKILLFYYHYYFYYFYYYLNKQIEIEILQYNSNPKKIIMGLKAYLKSYNQIFLNKLIIFQLKHKDVFIQMSPDTSTYLFE